MVDFGLFVKRQQPKERRKTDYCGACHGEFPIEQTVACGTFVDGARMSLVLCEDCALRLSEMIKAEVEFGHAAKTAAAARSAVPFD